MFSPCSLSHYLIQTQKQFILNEVVTVLDSMFQGITAHNLIIRYMDSDFIEL